MFYLAMRRLAFAAAVFLTPTLSGAQEVFGTIDVTLDGEERTWFLTAQDADSQSFGLKIAIANLQSFTLWGQPAQDSVTALEDTLLLSFDVMTVADQVIPLNASLTFLQDGWRSGWVAEDETAMAFALTTITETDEGIFVEGQFDATAGFKEPLTSGEVDAARSMQINGRFSATLPPFTLTEN